MGSLTCAACGEGLTGRQRKFCSDQCRKRHARGARASDRSKPDTAHALDNATPITDRAGTFEVLRRPPLWTRFAPCAAADLEVFFPPKGRSPDAARQLCADCKFRAECLDYGLEVDRVTGEATNDLDVAVSARIGVYGGLTGRERAEHVRGWRSAG